MNVAHWHFNSSRVGTLSWLLRGKTWQRHFAFIWKTCSQSQQECYVSVQISALFWQLVAYSEVNVRESETTQLAEANVTPRWFLSLSKANRSLWVWGTCTPELNEQLSGMGVRVSLEQNSYDRVGEPFVWRRPPLREGGVEIFQIRLSPSPDKSGQMLHPVASPHQSADRKQCQVCSRMVVLTSELNQMWHLNVQTEKHATNGLLCQVIGALQHLKFV